MQSIPDQPLYAHMAAGMPQNFEKNRFIDILPCELRY